MRNEMKSWTLNMYLLWITLNGTQYRAWPPCLFSSYIMFLRYKPLLPHQLIILFPSNIGYFQSVPFSLIVQIRWDQHNTFYSVGNRKKLNSWCRNLLSVSIFWINFISRFRFANPEVQTTPPSHLFDTTDNLQLSLCHSEPDNLT